MAIKINDNKNNAATIENQTRSIPTYTYSLQVVIIKNCLDSILNCK